MNMMRTPFRSGPGPRQKVRYYYTKKRDLPRCDGSNAEAPLDLNELLIPINDPNNFHSIRISRAAKHTAARVNMTQTSR